MAFEEEISRYAPETIVELELTEERKGIFGWVKRKIKLKGPKALLDELLGKLWEAEV